MPNCVSLGRPLGGRPGGSPRTSMGWDMTHRGRHRSYQGRPRTPRGRPNCPADVHGTVDALWTQQCRSVNGLSERYENGPHRRDICRGFPVRPEVMQHTGGHRTRVAAVTLDNMAEDAVAAFSKFTANSHRVCSLLRPSFCELIVNVMGHTDAEFRAAVIRHLAAIPT